MNTPKKVASYLLTTLFVVAPLAAYLQRQNIYDAWRLRNYDVPAQVASLATDTTMDDYARKVFYVSRPQLQDRDTFRASCSDFEKTIVLGCYRSGVGIFVYNVSDSRLNGVLQVTSAHEMLHAAYERLSRKDKANVDQLTAEAYASLTDKRVIKNIESYRSRDASVVPNELHSILATEVRILPAELENYYRRYFIDRSKIVGFSEQYEGEFTKREEAVAAYDAQLTTIKSDIASLNASLDDGGKDIERKNNELDSLLAQRSISTYNSKIPAYQRAVANYNADVGSLKAAINSYNDIVDMRNNIVTEEQELINAIDSSVPTTK